MKYLDKTLDMEGFIMLVLFCVGLVGLIVLS